MAKDKPQVPNYNDYLKLADLLALQGGMEEDEDALIPDELLFIVVHQALELWFKIILRELRLARNHLGEPQVPEEHIPHVVHHLRRVNRVLELASDHFQVMETLTPQDFLGFRDKIAPASGFQSWQMRELEILLGLSNDQRVRYGTVDPIEHLKKLSEGSPSGQKVWKRMQSVLAETSLQDALRSWVYRTPIHGSVPGMPDDDAIVEKFIHDYLVNFDAQMDHQFEQLQANVPESGNTKARFEGSKASARAFLLGEEEGVKDPRRLRRIRAGLLFIESYRTLPLLAWPRLLLDTVVELEELLLLWRNRHARMVERMIGRRVGTGGSSGVDYLDQTANIRIFKDLWAVRTVLLSKSQLPPLKDDTIYGFAR